MRAATLAAAALFGALVAALASSAAAESIQDILKKHSGGAEGAPPATQAAEEADVPPSAVRVQDDLTRECDLLTAAEFDQDLPAGVRRVYYEDIDTERALEACAAAMEAHPDNRRIVFQYGRALSSGKRYAEAMEHYRRAAEMGSAAALNNVGVLYHNGWGFGPDHREALRWFERSAAKGYPRAIFNVGLGYMEGEGVRADPDLAVEYYLKAVDAGSEDLFQMIRYQGERFSKRVIRLLQQHMIDRGHLRGAADGALGPATRRAFDVWQEAEGL